mmetsp:Transcript_100319/g.184233  ORF Transcript_100319/g.184233 Transcript_100319/m.184233 type:complete len:280 (+) Transcript_100319:3-842(+)
MALRRWPASGTPKAVLVLQHGGQWHSGYFNEPGKVLSAAGYEVVAADLSGHGYSEGPGGLTYYDRFSDMVDDLAAVVVHEKAKHPDTPIVLFAESWGALVGAHVGIRREPNLDGLIFGGGLFELLVTKISPVEKLVFRLLSRFAPKLVISNPGMNETFDSAFGLPEWAAAAREDSLIPGSPGMKHDRLYPRTAAETVLKAMPAVHHDAAYIEVPVLFIHSETDTRCGVSGAQAVFDKVSSIDKHFVAYPEASHQLFMDSKANVDRVIKDIHDWIHKRFP